MRSLVMTSGAIATRPIRQHAATVIVSIACGALLGLLAATSVIIAFASVLVLAFLTWATTASQRTVAASMLGSLTVLITGYAFLGRSFAYIGAGSVYVGEIVLMTSLLTLVIVGGFAVPARSRIVWLYAAFAAWGATLTARDVGTWGLDALRDSSIWYYGLFMVIGAWHFSERARIERAVRWVATVLPWLLAWIPVAYALAMGFGGALPHMPGSDVPVVTFKGGDMSIFLALTLVFLISCRARVAPFTQRWSAWTLWVLCITDFLVIATKNRGGLLSVMVATSIAFLLVPRVRAVQGLVIALAFVSIVAIANPHVQIDGGRELSLGQLQENVTSVMSDRSPGASAHSTEGWRLEFWRAIERDTIHGDYFWTGHGFGLNLADYYGYQVTADGSLRSPHNAAMAVLARMGVPGLAMFVLLNITYAVTIARAFLSARRMRDQFWTSVFLLLLVHWTATITNAMFDPYLEGPQGAIVFWTGMGIGIGAMHAFANRRREASALQPHAA